jgi:hypothetical protein
VTAALDGLAPAVLAHAVERIGSGTWDAWENQVRRNGGCSRPVRLRGRTIDTATGEVTYDTAHEPDGVLLKACGNRRASVCPSCSWLYRGDTWQLFNAGMAGGQGVPSTVAGHPMVFATLTAPSFGTVHGRRDGNRPCHPGQEGKLCEHGRPRWCRARHGDGDPSLGQPLCADCYDYEAAVLFNWHAPELWRRFTIALRRHLRRRTGWSEKWFRQFVRISFAKVAEFQRRGVVHFHAIVRLDAGTATGDALDEPWITVDSDDLADAIITAAASVRLTVDAGNRPVALRFGNQIDVRRLHSTGTEAVVPGTVAAYLSKYTTKAADDFGVPFKPDRRRLRRLQPDLLRRAGITPHVVAMVATANDLADQVNGLDQLAWWTHMLGFRGHFSTKSRRYSTTLGALRRKRATYARRLDQEARGLPVDEGDDTTLVVGEWGFAGIGYLNDGEALLAASIAAWTRESRQAAREAAKATA